jgi:UDP-N-acetyl-D-mannosaminuronic acid transferase (WecB/TagA/CpsF family)
MVKFSLQFSEDEISLFFRSHGLTVIDVTFVKHIPVYHNRTEEERFTTKCVVNPHNLRTIPISVAFEKVVLTAAKSLLFDGITKLHVIDSLNPNKK